jgi:aspartate/methionine/tyrosine aminotransferase
VVIRTSLLSKLVLINHFLNHVAADALTNSKNKEYFTNQKIFFKNISDNIEKELNTDSKIISSKFEGGWYKWIDLKNYSVELELMGINNSEELTSRLASEIGIIVVPGKSFGTEGLTFRISMIDEKMFLGIRELIEWLNRGTEHPSTSSR